MKSLIIDSSPATPEIHFNGTSGILKIQGRSIPENPEDFFNPLLAWLKSYFKDPLPQTEIHLILEYVNSGSAKFLLEILRMMKQQLQSGTPVGIKWYFEEEDESIEELGEHYRDLLKIPIEMIPIKSD
jgi:hypothetical protein